MPLGDVALSAVHTPGASVFYLEGLTGLLPNLAFVPNQITVYQKSTYGTAAQVSGTYSITSISAAMVGGCVLVSGVDIAYQIGDFVALQANYSAGGGGSVSVSPTSLYGNTTGSTSAGQSIALGTGLQFSGSTLVNNAPSEVTIMAVLGQSLPVTVGTNAAGNYVVAPKPGSFLRWDIACVQGPVGQSMILDVARSTNSGTSWTSLWTPGNRPTVAAVASGPAGASGTIFDVSSTFNAGDWLRFDVIQVGTTFAGQNISIQILTGMGP